MESKVCKGLNGFTRMPAITCITFHKDACNYMYNNLSLSRTNLWEPVLQGQLRQSNVQSQYLTGIQEFEGSLLSPAIYFS